MMENVRFAKDTGIESVFNWAYVAKMNKIKAIMADSKDAEIWTDLCDGLAEIFNKHGLMLEFNAWAAEKRK